MRKMMNNKSAFIPTLAAVGIGGILLVAMLFSPALAIAISILINNKLVVWMLGGIVSLALIIILRRS